MKLSLKRGRIVYTVIGMVILCELAVLFYQSGIVRGLNTRADKLKAYATISRDDATILPGDLYDRNGKLLVETVLQNEGKADEKKYTWYCDGRAYSQLIGYTGDHILNPSAGSVEDVVSDRMDYRLMAFLDDEYWGDHGLYQTVGIDGTKGENVVLTLDHPLQIKVYELLSKQMNAEHERGSAVVMDAKTGEILSMVAFPTYDFNDLSSARAEMIKAEEETDLQPGYPVSHKGAVAPGSIFKVVTAVSLIDHGMESFAADDTPFIVNGWKCRNAYSSSGDRITYQEGLVRSSNVFYAQAALALGADRLNETAEKFMLADNKQIYDFGSIDSNWDLDVTEDVLAQTGFGQGKTELTTVSAVMITQAIANEGRMMKPYVVQELIDANGRSVYKGKPEILSRAASRHAAQKVTQAMLESAQYQIRHYYGSGSTADLFEKYQVAGKTGTAQTGSREKPYNAWYISFAPADAPQYVVVVNQCGTQKAGYQMMSACAEIYQYLFQER